jgi:hypothetical protein
MAHGGPHGNAAIEQMPDDPAAEKAGPADDHDELPAIRRAMSRSTCHGKRRPWR